MASQAGNIWAMGGQKEDYKNLWKGAAIGAVSGFVSSQQFGNLIRGKGFYSNDNVLKNFKAGKYDTSGFDTWQDAALDYFGFEGKYNPNLKSKNYQSESYWGGTNKNTGDITYGDLAFENYSTLKGTYYKESFTSYKVKNGIPLEQIPDDLKGLGFDTYMEEIHGYIYMNIKTKGFIQKTTFLSKELDFIKSSLIILTLNILLIQSILNGYIKFQEDGEKSYCYIARFMCSFLPIYTGHN